LRTAAIFCLACLVLATCPGPAAGSAGAAPPPPNVVLILADDLGYGDVSCFNPASRIQTDHVDALARHGMRFTDAHSGSSVCTPTRYGILTGRYAWRTRLKKGVLNGYSEPLLEPGTTTVADLLRARGYATACAGKWHLGLGWPTREGAAGPASGRNVDFTRPLTDGPHTHGFDDSFVLPASLDMPPYVYVNNGKVTDPTTRQLPDSPHPAFYRGGAASGSFDHGTTLLEITHHATAWLDARKGDQGGRPFFLYVALTSPHTPHVPRPEFRGKSGAGHYGDFVLETDWAVGRITDALERNKLADDTLIIFTSDNGAHARPLRLEETYGHSPNGPLRGQKSDAWDGGHRVPFVARWPGHVPAGSACDRTVSLVDLFATCADLAGAPLPPDAAEDSFTLLPLLLARPDAPPRPAVITHSNDGVFAVHQEGWKLILARGSGGWSLPEANVPPDAPPIQLYNTHDDPGERTNVADKQPDAVARLKKTLELLQQSGRTRGVQPDRAPFGAR
jgi:arylsulfatase A-like enzyme